MFSLLDYDKDVVAFRYIVSCLFIESLYHSLSSTPLTQGPSRTIVATSRLASVRSAKMRVASWRLSAGLICRAASRRRPKHRSKNKDVKDIVRMHTSDKRSLVPATCTRNLVSSSFTSYFLINIWSGCYWNRNECDLNLNPLTRFYYPLSRLHDICLGSSCLDLESHISCILDAL